jgi:hypothetical protein
LVWFGREDVSIDEKEACIQALTNFDDTCGKFYYYRTYFLAAGAIAEFPESERTQEVIDRLLQWRFAKFIPAQNSWQFYPAPIQEGARLALRQTDRATAIAGLEQKDIVLDEQLPLRITTLKDYEIAVENGDRSTLALECYKLLWYCAEQLPCQIFNQIWVE